MTTRYLKNAWYVAAMSAEIADKPLRRVFLEEAVVLFRREDGNVSALADRCAHRFAPLSRGKIVGNNIQCAYHGLQYGPDGKCVINPHGTIPREAVVRAYALLERYGLIWIWMGDLPADESKLPDLSPFNVSEGRSRQEGYLCVKANYQLIIDNLLDLSHVEYLHPAFTSAGAVEVTKHEVVVKGDVVHSNRYKPGCKVSPMLSRCWGRADSLGDSRSCIAWHPPGIHYLEIGVTELGADIGKGITIPILHLLTPQDSNSTHYFWAVTRSSMIEDSELDLWLQRTLGDAFHLEDEPMIEAQHHQIGSGVDIMSLGPVLLPPDVAPVKARRILARLIAEERQSPVVAEVS